MTEEERKDKCAQEDFDAGMINCYQCWKYFNEDELTKINSIFGEKVCKDCLGEHYQKCMFCEEYFLTEEMVNAFPEDRKKTLICEECSIVEE